MAVPPGSAEFLRVFARIRPSAHGTTKSAVEVQNTRNLRLNLSGNNGKAFQFDQLFDQNSEQTVVFEAFMRIIEGALLGMNGTIFAYGQTGSGKTHTMLGNASVDGFIGDDDAKGIIPRSAEFLFNLLDKKKSELNGAFEYSVSCSFVELYNETVYDLLSEDSGNLYIRGDKKVELVGAVKEAVATTLDMMRVLENGWRMRTVAETSMNRESSRSHAVFMIDISMVLDQNGIENRLDARLNLVDLAGSERQNQAQTTGVRLKEAGNINKSLSTLGRVIRALGKPKRGDDDFVPYRDSKLTHMLRDSLGGNCRTAVIVALHPDSEYYAETLSTLQFADNCKLVKNHTSINQRIGGKSVLALEAEVERLMHLVESSVAEEKQKSADELAQLRNEAESWRTAAREREKEMSRLQVMVEVLQSAQLNQYTSPDELRPFLDDIASRWDVRSGESNSVEDLNQLGMERELREAKAQIALLKEKLRGATNRLSIAGVMNETCGDNVLDLTNNMDALMMTPRDRKNRRRTGLFTPADQARIRRGTVHHDIAPVLLFEETENQASFVSVPDTVLESVDVEKAQLVNQLEEARQLISKFEATQDELKENLVERTSTLQNLEEAMKTKCAELFEELAKARASDYDARSSVTALEQELKEKSNSLIRLNEELDNYKHDLKLEIAARHVAEEAKRGLEQQLDEADQEFEQKSNELEAANAMQKQRVDEQVRSLMENQRHESARQGEKTEHMELLIFEAREKAASLEHQLADTRRTMINDKALLTTMQAKVVEKTQEISILTESMRGLGKDKEQLELQLMRLEDKFESQKYEMELDMENERRRLDRRIVELEAYLNQEKAALLRCQDDQREQVKRSEEELAAAEEEKQDLRDRIDDLDQDLKDAAKELGEKRRELSREQNRFDTKMEELKKTFAASTERSDENTEKYRKEAEECWREYNTLQVAHNALEENLRQTIGELQEVKNQKRADDERMAILEDQHAKDVETMGNVGGHGNNKQKIRLVAKQAAELTDLRTEVASLKEELSTVKRVRTSLPTGSQRITRSVAAASDKK